MELPPLIELEMSRAARRKRTYGLRVGAGLVAMATLLGLLSPSIRGLQPTTTTGPQLFLLLAWGGFAACWLAGAFVTADCLSAEKRERTLELLLLTKLPDQHVVLGKFIAGAVNPLYAVTSVLPILALTLVLGGVTSGEFWRIALALVNTLFFSLAFGMAISALSVRAYRAVGTTAVLLLVTAISSALDLALSTPGSLGSPLTQWTPIFTLFAGFAAHYAVVANGYWQSLLLTHFAAWVCLWLAVRRLRTGMDQAHDAVPAHRSARAAKRAVARRQALLEATPVLWLANRGQSSRMVLLTSLGLAAGLLACSFVWLQGLGISAQVVFGTALILHFTIKCWLAMVASGRLTESRRIGELELLLVTPLAIPDIIKGRMLALKRQFLLPAVLVTALDLELLLSGSGHPEWWGQPSFWGMAFLVNIVTFIADCYTISWVGFWEGLNARTPLLGFAATVQKVLLLPWLIFLVSVGLLGIVFGTGTWVIAWWLILNLVNGFGWCSWANTQLEGRFSVAAAGAP